MPPASPKRHPQPKPPGHVQADAWFEALLDSYHYAEPAPVIDDYPIFRDYCDWWCFDNLDLHKDFPEDKAHG